MAITSIQLNIIGMAPALWQGARMEELGVRRKISRGCFAGFFWFFWGWFL